MSLRKGERTGLETRESLGVGVGLSKRSKDRKGSQRQKEEAKYERDERKTGYAQLLLIDVPF